jgi:lantibiotic modifying enzyme
MISEKNWQPLADGNLKSTIEAKLMEIAAYTEKHRATLQGYGLFGGQAGLAVFFCYLYKFTGEEKYYDLTAECIQDVIYSIRKDPSPSYTHSSGLSGIAWSLDFLHKEGFLEERSVDLLGTGIQAALSVIAKRCLEKDNLDFMHGATGVMLYLLEYGNIEPEIIEAFIRKSIEEEEMVRWPSFIGYDSNENGINLSLAHGNASILFLLLQYYRKQGTQYRRTLDKLISFFLSSTFTESSRISSFPGYILFSKHKDLEMDSRIGWCYGDIGISYTLFVTSLALGDEVLQQKALGFLQKAAKRRKPAETYIADAGFCHGSIGVAHLYNRVYQITGKDEFKSAALYFYQDTIDHARYGKEFAGFRPWRDAPQDNLKGSLGLLEGIAGIGLGLLASITDTAPGWDTFFLLS